MSLIAVHFLLLLYKFNLYIYTEWAPYESKNQLHQRAYCLTIYFVFFYKYEIHILHF